MSERNAYFLDHFGLSDAAVLCRVDHDPEHRRRFEFPDDFVPSLRHSENVIRQWEEERRAGTRFSFAVRDAWSKELVGGCEIQAGGDYTANLSYWTHPDHRRRGIASEAVRLACDLAYEQLGIRRVEVLTDSDNVGSRRVALRNRFEERGTRSGRILYVHEASR